ncbi:hypothetical protein PG996_010547 [Apiospora saccharicola]|uniref:Rhodopsin domain-containing protein n=1 Tax=Apiospora saccharicola TaxID=335842 RepID=A0ABR1UNW8_9PEZI
MSVYQGVVYAAAPPQGITPNPDEPHQANTLVVVTGGLLAAGGHHYGDSLLHERFHHQEDCKANKLLLASVLNFGLGIHMWNVPLSELFPHFMLKNVIAAILFCLATGLAKGSILLFYLRIFPSKPMRLAIWGVFAFTIGYSVASALVNVFSCNPIQGSWRLEESATAVCINRPAFYFAQASFGIATDIATVILPLPMLRSLHLPLKQKVGVSVVLTMGAFVCVVSIIRLQSLYTLLTDSDLTINTVNALMWVILELTLSIIGGSIPALKPFAQRHCPILLGSSRNASNDGYYMHSKSNTGKKPTANRSGDSGYPTSDHFRHKASASKGDTGRDPNGSEECIVMQDQITKTVQYGYEVQSVGHHDDLESGRGRQDEEGKETKTKKNTKQQQTKRST